MKMFAIALLCTLLAGCAAPTPSRTPLASPAASPAIACMSEHVDLPSGGPMKNECPTAIVAFEAVAARLGTSARLRIEPSDFACADLWPGVGSARPCMQVMRQPGSEMHGWASFAGPDKVAAISL